MSATDTQIDLPDRASESALRDASELIESSQSSLVARLAPLAVVLFVVALVLALVIGKQRGDSNE